MGPLGHDNEGLCTKNIYLYFPRVLFFSIFLFPMSEHLCPGEPLHPPRDNLEDAIHRQHARRTSHIHLPTTQTNNEQRTAPTEIDYANIWHVLPYTYCAYQGVCTTWACLVACSDQLPSYRSSGKRAVRSPCISASPATRQRRNPTEPMTKTLLNIKMGYL